MNNLIVYCEIEDGIIADVSLELLTKGRTLANKEDPMEKGKATPSSILAWRIPWTTAHGVAKSWT